ncbi:aminoacyl-tRNA hydrolase [Candidatus Uhrbacteria bacterium]|nr:aminoacyl-tRNA hydrolase [Candidatus Uhrbacteria bacterium]
MDWLIVGLGNPGPEYAQTRHNAGAMAIEAILRRHGDGFGSLAMNRKFKALTAKGRLAGRKVMLAFPQTFMNLSGQAVAAIASFHKINPDRILVIADEKDIPLGRLRLRLSGSAGGHNGLKSIIERLGTRDFPRLRIGIGTETSKRSEAADFVLGRPSAEELAELKAAAERAAEAVRTLLADGPESAMGKFN